MCVRLCDHVSMEGGIGDGCTGGEGARDLEGGGRQEAQGGERQRIKE